MEINKVLVILGLLFLVIIVIFKTLINDVLITNILAFILIVLSIYITLILIGKEIG